MIPETSYADYLKGMKNKIYKALCLYEEKSETFSKYFNSLIYIEIYGLRYWLEPLPHSHWYVETLSRLTSLADRQEDDFSERKLFKTELFGIMKLIDNQLEEIEKEE